MIWRSSHLSNTSYNLFTAVQLARIPERTNPLNFMSFIGNNHYNRDGDDLPASYPFPPVTPTDMEDVGGRPFGYGLYPHSPSSSSSGHSVNLGLETSSLSFDTWKISVSWTLNPLEMGVFEVSTSLSRP